MRAGGGGDAAPPGVRRGAASPTAAPKAAEPTKPAAAATTAPAAGAPPPPPARTRPRPARPPSRRSPRSRRRRSRRRWIALSIATYSGLSNEWQLPLKLQADKNPNVDLKMDEVLYSEMGKKQLAMLASGTMNDVVFSGIKWFPYSALALRPPDRRLRQEPEPAWTTSSRARWPAAASRASSTACPTCPRTATWR